MELSFEYSPERQFYALRFTAGAYECVPFIRELRFWGVDRAPSPSMSTMAALIALKTHPLSAVTVRGVSLNPPVCTALSRFFGVEIHPATYNANSRELLGGERVVAPVRFARDGGQRRPGGVQALTWVSLDDLGGPLGGNIRTNIDAFDLTESERNLIISLCCAGKDVGHVVIDGAGAEYAQVFHQVGLELIDTADLLDAGEAQ